MEVSETYHGTSQAHPEDINNYFDPLLDQLDIYHSEHRRLFWRTY